jgi:hypothetical protein
MAQVTTAQYAQNITALDRVIADLKAKIGVFLANQSAIYSAQDRAKALAQSAQGAAQGAAGVLVTKGDALLKAQTATEGVAQGLINQATLLRGKTTTPLYSFLSTSPIYWGFRQYELLTGLISETTKIAGQAASLAIQVARQNADVKTYVSEVRQTEGAATGTGIIPRIQGIISGTVSSTVGAAASGLSKIIWPVAIVGALAAVAYVAAPGLLGRGKR